MLAQSPRNLGRHPELLHAYLERGIEREFAQHGLNIAEFNALSALRRVGPPFRVTPD